MKIAIDGPSGSGKSSVSKGVAKEFGFAYLDTGAMYRALAWHVLNQDVDLADEAAIAASCATARVQSGTDPANPTIAVDGVDVAAPIRTDEVTAAVSAVSAVPAVRTQLVELQREVARDHSEPGIVMEGRDIGTTVLPDADVKIFLTADPVARARRRAAQDAQERGVTANVDDTEESLLARDKVDSSRKASPLRAAADAITVDATVLDLPQTIDAVAEIVKGRS